MTNSTIQAQVSWTSWNVLCQMFITAPYEEPYVLYKEVQIVC